MADTGDVGEPTMLELDDLVEATIQKPFALHAGGNHAAPRGSCRARHAAMTTGAFLLRLHLIIIPVLSISWVEHPNLLHLHQWRDAVFQITPFAIAFRIAADLEMAALDVGDGELREVNQGRRLAHLHLPVFFWLGLRC
jgi:hypothetical protein